MTPDDIPCQHRYSVQYNEHGAPHNWEKYEGKTSSKLRKWIKIYPNHIQPDHRTKLNVLLMVKIDKRMEPVHLPGVGWVFKNGASLHTIMEVEP